MGYPYSAINRLREPHDYMYSPYQGTRFMQMYWEDRIGRVLSLPVPKVDHSDTLEAQSYAVLEALLGADGGFPDSRLASLLATTATSPKCSNECELSSVFPNPEPLETAALLAALIHHFLMHASESTKNGVALQWLDRMVQRFEVGKKIYAKYAAGFRKGEGPDSGVELYQNFALVLALAHARQGGLQYLSTLLKVNDLLLSLPAEAHAGRGGGITLTVAVELDAVRRLAKAKGVDLEND